MVKKLGKDWMPTRSEKSNYLDSYSSQKLDPSNPAQFQAKMVEFCRANKTAADALLAGNIQLLGFEHVRDSFGDRWPQVKAKVHLLTESVIKKMITSDDIYVLANDEQFIVLFGMADREKAARKSKLIADEVNQRLHGFSDGTEGLSVRALILEVPAGKPDKLESVNELAKSVQETQKEKEEEECLVFVEAKAEMRLSFWPVTNIRKRLVSMYQAAVVVPEGAMPETDSETGALEAAVDTFALTNASAALIEAAGQKKRAFLIVPVRLETIDIKRYRDAYIEQCRLLPQLASRRLFLMVEGIPDDVPQSKLHGVFSYVAPFVAGFVGRFNMGFDRGDKLGGISMVGMAADGSGVDNPSPEDLVTMSDFVVKNRAGKSRTFFINTVNFDAASMARRAHFDYVQGVGVAPAMAQFGTVFSIT